MLKKTKYIKWTDKVPSEDVIRLLLNPGRKKANWIGKILCRNCYHSTSVRGLEGRGRWFKAEKISGHWRRRPTIRWDGDRAKSKDLPSGIHLIVSSSSNSVIKADWDCWLEFLHNPRLAHVHIFIYNAYNLYDKRG